MQCERSEGMSVGKNFEDSFVNMKRDLLLFFKKIVIVVKTL